MAEPSRCQGEENRVIEYYKPPWHEYKEGTLILDLVKPAKRQLVWRATIVDALQDSSKDNVELGNKAIAKAFESYSPPENSP